VGVFNVSDDRQARTQLPTNIDPSALAHHRSFHATRHAEIAPLAVGVGVAATALGAKYALEAYEQYQAKKAKGENPMAWGRSAYGTKFYEGGFDPEMTRREAALILGVRESADKKRIQNAYRRLLQKNHPDTGGSTFLATKLNEAKDLLLK
jgi:hypothetical protein